MTNKLTDYIQRRKQEIGKTKQQLIKINEMLDKLDQSLSEYSQQSLIGLASDEQVEKTLNKVEFEYWNIILELCEVNDVFDRPKAEGLERLES